MRIQEKCSKDRTEKIIFRVKPEMKQFVREFSEKQGVDVSDFMRMMLNFFYMAYFTDSMSYEDLKRKFFSMYPNGAKNDKHTG
jgi:hypothetical protein